MTLEILTEHALKATLKRNISMDLVKQVLEKPDQIIPQKDGREVWQSQIHHGENTFVLRLIIEKIPKIRVITVYQSSKLKKYWQEDA